MWRDCMSRTQYAHVLDYATRECGTDLMPQQLCSQSLARGESIPVVSFQRFSDDQLCPLDVFSCS